MNPNMSGEVPYTDAEKKQIYDILHLLFQNPETRAYQISELERIGGNGVSFHYTLTVPKVCGDGNRRYSPAEYLDYLFQNPTLDTMLDTVSAADTVYTYTYDIDSRGIFTATTKMKDT